MDNKTFEEIKQDILKRANEKDARIANILDFKKATNKSELLLFIKKYIWWLHNTESINANWLEDNFGTEMLSENHIYTSGVHRFEVREDNTVRLMALGTAHIECIVLGNSNVFFELFDNSIFICDVLDDSNVTCVARHNSNAFLETWDNSNSFFQTLDNSNVECVALENSNVTIETWDNSNVICKARDKSIITCGQYNLSKLTHYLGDGACPIIKNLTERKIYIKTSNFKIVKIY